MRKDDIERGLSLCRSAGWNQLARDWEIFLQQGPDGCRVAEINEKVLGTVTTMRYQHFFSWIGMVLVDPAYQRQGIGMQLLREALQILQMEETVKLDATPAGREVYLKLNFVDEYLLSRMEAVITGDKLKDSAARSINENEIPALIKFDREIFGADRRSLLTWMWKGALEYAYVVMEKNDILGYCAGRNGDKYTQIGPVIAKNVGVARQLVSAALSNCHGRQVILDVPHQQPQWLVWLASVGFTEQRNFMRMYRGPNRFPGLPEKIFAIAGPEFG